jgi:hypothetical protein
MEFEEMLQAIPDEKLRADIKAKYQEVNQQKGEFGRKLIEKDGEINGLKTEKQTYGKAAESLKKSGIDPDQIPKLLEKLGYQKTMEDEYEITKVVLGETKKTNSELAAENKRLKAEKAMTTLFNKERANLKDEKGQPVKLAEKFINYEKLFDVNDFTNETVLQEKCKSVLNEAYGVQTEVFREIGHVGVKAHVTPDGKQTTTPQVLNIEEVMKTQGAAAAIMAMHASNQSK